MSNPMRFLNKNVTSIANAVKRTLDNQKAHVEHRINKMQDQQIRETEDLIAMEMEKTITDILPRAEEIIAKKMDLPERGYFATHRNFGHLLPDHLKWTVVGVEVINAVMARIPVTAPWLPKWEHDIELHIEEVRANMERKEEQRIRFEADNAEVAKMVREEIIRLFKTRDPLCRNYHKLMGYLRHGMPKGFQGSRGVRIINAVISETVVYSRHWTEMMDNVLETAVERDREYRESKKNKR